MANKIGIVTWHYYANFGSGLQAFALQRLISDMGYDVKIINYRNPLLGKRVWWRDVAKFLLHNTIGVVNRKVYEITSQGVERYQYRYFRQTKSFTNPEEICEVVKDFSCLVYGSDQIWAPNVYDPIYMGKYVPKHVRKISYAASIGLNDIPTDLVDIYKENLSSYSSISIREEEGKELLKKKCGIDATVVLDPTLMVNADIYRKMQRPVKGIKGKFIYCYFLNKEHQYREKVEEYARKHKLQIVGSSYKKSDSEWMTKLINIGADQFLWLINNAETIFTDSYHGSIFSLLFHKNLWTFVRFEENSPVCQNSRIRQLQKNFNLGHRIISAKGIVDDSKNIDFDYFEMRLAELRLDSISYIKAALK
ncbi:MAG: polysaccharide pyruvyl transferase family protein [Paludibacteraceae bacterium]|nr:polysaccharide pyruvyl transferase family protein [Lachnospiraceae bacterium]MBR5822705.1 polysaccharide pyruvyl transferase family protein [Paludibacteraceae bacterium]